MSEDETVSPFLAWRRRHQGSIVIAVGVMFVVAILALFAFQLGAGPGVVVFGIVTGIGITESETGSHSVAHLEINGRPVVVSLSRANACQVGDRIRVYRHKQPLGASYAAALEPCDLGERQNAQAR